ncbi:hypothetical protein SELMODRAFT_444303 [Selaginella moellendorffii]|uniref:Uncharacterized protein n=1 Tax=Selaginella moellendorffii TaxID=88036 RepID=D8S8V1_SELML|nr:hypothetical protein SELMODRAFT_444303 [Selaginella moellendorffii]
MASEWSSRPLLASLALLASLSAAKSVAIPFVDFFATFQLLLVVVVVETPSLWSIARRKNLLGARATFSISLSFGMRPELTRTGGAMTRREHNSRALAALGAGWANQDMSRYRVLNWSETIHYLTSHCDKSNHSGLIKIFGGASKSESGWHLWAGSFLSGGKESEKPKTEQPGHGSGTEEPKKEAKKTSGEVPSYSELPDAAMQQMGGVGAKKEGGGGGMDTANPNVVVDIRKGKPFGKCLTEDAPEKTEAAAGELKAAEGKSSVQDKAVDAVQETVEAASAPKSEETAL